MCKCVWGGGDIHVDLTLGGGDLFDSTLCFYNKI